MLGPIYPICLISLWIVMYLCSRVISYPWAIEFRSICSLLLCAISLVDSHVQLIDDYFLDGRHSIQETASLLISSFPEWCFVPLLTAFTTLPNCFWWSVIASLLFCLPVWLPLIFCLYFLPPLLICWMICVLHSLVLCPSANGLVLHIHLLF